MLTINRYDDDDNEHTCVVISTVLASPPTLFSPRARARIASDVMQLPRPYQR